MIAAAWIVGSYLLGSVPFSLLVAGRVKGIDLRRVGSGNPGATNVLRSVGVLSACAVLALDVGKGALPVLGAIRLGLTPGVAAAGGVAAVAGHVFSIFLGFRGGKGVATAVGAMGSLAPLPTVTAAALWVVVVLTTRYVSLGSVVMVAWIPLSAAILGSLGLGDAAQPPALVAGAAIAILVIARHTGNLERIRAGTERRLGPSSRSDS